MTAADLRELQPEWVDPISTTYRGWDVYELPPNTQGIAALMMLNLMEQFPLGEYGFHSTRALHVMIEAKKLAYADMLRYVADVRTSQAPISAMLDKAHAKRRARRIGAGDAARDVQPSVFDGLTNLVEHRHDLSPPSSTSTATSSRWIQSIYEGFGSAIVPPGQLARAAQPWRVFTLDETHPNALAPRKRPLQMISSGVHTARRHRASAFGITGAFWIPVGAGLRAVRRRTSSTIDGHFSWHGRPRRPFQMKAVAGPTCTSKPCIGRSGRAHRAGHRGTRFRAAHQHV